MSITLIIIIFTAVTSIIAFSPGVGSLNAIRREDWFDKFKFNAVGILKYKQFYRIFTYGFIHANWIHLIFNMLTLYFFGEFVEKVFVQIIEIKYPQLNPAFGKLTFLIYYFLGIIVSTIFDTIKYRNSAHYNAVGASGAVSGVLFSAILFNPTMKIGFLFIPIPIPAWIFGLIYLIYSAYMAKKQIDNIGHSAHFWGAVFGFVFPIIFMPELIYLFFQQIIYK